MDALRGESNRNKSLFENVPHHMRTSSIGDEGEDCSTQAGNNYNGQRSNCEGNTQIMNQRPSFLSSIDYTSFIGGGVGEKYGNFSPETQDR